MALITCPECGQSISDRAKACIHCGYPLDELHVASTTCPECGQSVLAGTKVCANCGYPLDKKDESASAEMIEAKGNEDCSQEMPEISISEGPVNEKESENSQHALLSNGKNSIALISIVALIVIAIIVAVALGGAGTVKNYMQFGIKPGMNVGEIKRQLQDNGFSFDYDYKGFYYFKSGYVFGVRTGTTYFVHGDDYAFEIVHRCGRDTSTYDTLYEKLVKEYGQPHSERTGSVYKKYAQWKNTETELELVLDSDNDVLFRYSCYVKEKIK